MNLPSLASLPIASPSLPALELELEVETHEKKALVASLADALARAHAQAKRRNDRAMVLEWFRPGDTHVRIRTLQTPEEGRALGGGEWVLHSTEAIQPRASAAEARPSLKTFLDDATADDLERLAVLIAEASWPSDTRRWPAAVRSVDHPLQLVGQRHFVYDGWPGIPQWDPSFPGAFEAMATNVAVREKWTLQCATTPSERTLYPFQRLVSLAFHPAIGRNVKIGVFTATGSGKTLMMSNALDNFIDDGRPAVVIMDNQVQIDNFFTKAFVHSEHARRFERATGRSAAGDLQAFKTWLRNLDVPLAAYTYTSVISARARRGGDKVLNHRDVDQLLNGRVVVFDEAHNLDKAAHGSAATTNLDELRSQLLHTSESAVMYCTATPTEALEAYFTTGAHPLASNAYAITFNDTRSPMYPPVVGRDDLIGSWQDAAQLQTYRIDPLSDFRIVRVPMVGDAIGAYMKLEREVHQRGTPCGPGLPQNWASACRRLQHKCNEGSKMACLRQYLAEAMRDFPRKVVVMVLSSTYHNMHELVKRVKEDLPHIPVESFGKADDAEAVAEARAQIAGFSDAPADTRAIAFLDADVYKESIDLANVSELILLNPPAEWTWLVQVIGRVLRGCQNAPTTGVAITTWIATHPLLPTADEVALATVLGAQRTIAEAAKRRRARDSLCSTLLRDLMQLPPDATDPNSVPVPRLRIDTRAPKKDGAFHTVARADATLDDFHRSIGAPQALRGDVLSMLGSYITEWKIATEDEIVEIVAKWAPMLLPPGHPLLSKKSKGRGGRGQGRGQGRGAGGFSGGGAGGGGRGTWRADPMQIGEAVPTRYPAL